MKKLLLLATAALLVTGVAFADNGKKKTKKGTKGKACCTKACCKDKAKTAKTAKM